jgi:hypothetical protein
MSSESELVQTLLEEIEGADAKIDEFQTTIVQPIIEECPNAVPSDLNFEAGQEGRLNDGIDEIIAEFWSILGDIVDKCPAIPTGEANYPAIWRNKPALSPEWYGPKSEDTLRLINVLEPHARGDLNFGTQFRILIALSDRKERRFVPAHPDVSTGGVSPRLYPYAKIPEIALIVPLDTNIQSTMSEAEHHILAQPNAISTILHDINDGIRSLVEQIVIPSE